MTNLQTEILEALDGFEVEIEDRDIKHLPTIKALQAEVAALKRQLTKAPAKLKAEKTETTATAIPVRYSPI